MNLPSDTNSFPAGWVYCQRMRPGLRRYSSPSSVRVRPWIADFSVNLTSSVWIRLYRSSTPFRIFWISGSGSALRREAVNNPIAVNAAIAQAIVQTMVALLPKFNFVGFDNVASPICGTRRSAFRIPGFQSGEGALQRLPGFDHFTLPRNRGAESASQGPRMEIRIRFRGVDFRD